MASPVPIPPADPTSGPFAWLQQLPFANFFPDFLKTWNYDPRTQWFNRFITINNNVNDAPAEASVLKNVGSYGLQLGQILDALDVLVAHTDTKEMSLEDQTKLGKVVELRAATKAAVKPYRAPQ
jgi:hypothetical protein